MKKLTILFITAIITLSTYAGDKPFPQFRLKTSEGKIVTNNNLLGKKSIIVMFHLGCRPAMTMLDDLA